MNTTERKRTLLAILGGDLVEDASGQWRTTTAKDPGDQYGILWDRLRLEAGWALYQGDPQLYLVVLGGKSDKPGAPLIAMVMKQELMELGVPGEAIVTEEESTTTYQQLLGLQEIVQERAGDHVRILTNAYHLTRVQAMIEDGPKLSTLKDLLAVGRLTVQAAEEVLVERDPETWRAEIDTVYQSEAMQARINREANGVRQIRQGTYRFG
jgi:DUF218 domain